jgi:hypothetical protein
VFEIGNSLHEARVRQGLGLPVCESATKIRAKYLKALEEEQFELLPAQTYVKGFLRTYADYLGLDGQLYVDEYSSRFVVGDDDGRMRPRRSSARPQRRSGFESNVVLVTLAAIALVAALVIVAWKSGSSNHRQLIDSSSTLTAAAPKRAAQRPKVAHLVVSARGGNSVLEVHVGSPAGRLLFQGTLLRGKSVALDGKRLWLSLGTPTHLQARLNGKVVKLRRTSVVTAAGVQGA